MIKKNVRTDVAARWAYMRRLAVVFSSELRIKIVSELYQREMSATQFFEEFGGGSVARVDRHFKVLLEHGWLRFVRQAGPDSRRRGGIERFYRAPELAVFGNETWALVPYSVRVAISWRTFKTLAERVRDALVAGTLDARPERHFGYRTLQLDESGWDRVIEAVDRFAEEILEEQADSRLRISHSGEEPMSATLALLAFESFEPARGRETPELVKAAKDSPIPFTRRMAKVFADEMCLQIIGQANTREISAPIFHREFGGSKPTIWRRFKELQEQGWLLQVDERTGGKNRGGRERIYRAAAPPLLENERWAIVPSGTSSFSWNVFLLLADLVKEAIDSGTFDARLDNHLSWSAVRLDRQGWEKVIADIDRLVGLVRTEAEGAAERLARSGESPIATILGIAAFESPATKEP